MSIVTGKPLYYSIVCWRLCSPCLVIEAGIIFDSICEVDSIILIANKINWFELNISSFICNVQDNGNELSCASDNVNQNMTANVVFDVTLTDTYK